MENKEVVEEKNLMSEEEFKKTLEDRRNKMMEDISNGVLYLRDYNCVKRFKSVRRAIKRGHMSILGDIYPKRPFNNAPNTCKRKGKHSRKINELKKKIYVGLRKSQVL